MSEKKYGEWIKISTPPKEGQEIVMLLKSGKMQHVIYSKDTDLSKVNCYCVKNPNYKG